MLDIMLTPIIIGGIATIFGAVIAITDSIVNNYGECKIDINAGKKEVIVQGGSSLLKLMGNQDIFLPSACGGRGTCAACKTIVNSDIGPILPTETPYMTKEELAQNVRLACQIKVKQDMDIEIPEYLFNVKQFAGKVIRMEKKTHDIYELYINLGGDTTTFTAGMYMQLVIPPYAKNKGTTQRAYSISSQPTDTENVEFLVRLVPGGIATTYVHEHVKVGDDMGLIGPFGDFYRRENDSTMICVAGGSGMAPFRSILRDMEEKGQTDIEVWYFFGAVTKRDSYYLEEFEEMEKRWPNLHFIVALSAPLPEDNWTGATGLITEVLDSFLQEKIGRDKPREAYLCGSPGMIDACNLVFVKNEVPEDMIHYDKF